MKYLQFFRKNSRERIIILREGSSSYSDTNNKLLFTHFRADFTPGAAPIPSVCNKLTFSCQIFLLNSTNSVRLPFIIHLFHRFLAASTFKELIFYSSSNYIISHISFSCKSKTISATSTQL